MMTSKATTPPTTPATTGIKGNSLTPVEKKFQVMVINILNKLYYYLLASKVCIPTSVPGTEPAIENTDTR